jgi:hypothetical protein
VAWKICSSKILINFMRAEQEVSLKMPLVLKGCPSRKSILFHLMEKIGEGNNNRFINLRIKVK